MLVRLLSPLLLLAVPGLTGSGPETARTAYGDGLAALEQGRPDAARELLQAAVREAPTWVLPRIALAELALARSEDLPRVRRDLREVAVFAPQNPRLHRLLGDVELALGNDDAAVDAWGQSLGLNFVPDVSARRAATLSRLGRHGDAADEYARYVEHQPDELFMRARRAAELEEAGRLDEARVELANLARIQKDSEPAARQLARFLERHGTPAEAAAAHDSADARSGRAPPGRRMRPLPPSKW